MSEMDVFAAMGIAGFGKTQKKRELDPTRFEKNRRADVRAFLLVCMYDVLSNGLLWIFFGLGVDFCFC